MKKGKFTSATDESLFAYITQVKRISLLTFEEEQELSQRIQAGDESARRRLIEGNLRLVIKIARNYMTPDTHLMDLIQEGNMGLMRAVEKYDHFKQVRFSTYAFWWIRQAISRYLSNKRRAIRLPHKKEEILRKIHRVHHSLSQLYARKPKSDEIAAEIGVPREDVESLLNLSLETISFEIENDDETSTNIIGNFGDNTYCPERLLMKKSSRETTLAVLNKLKDREKKVLIKRYKLDGEKRGTLRDISNNMGLAPETIRQIEIKALEKLRHHHAEDLRPFYEVS